MKRIIQLTCIALAASLVGCAIHDDHQEESPPLWWPSFMYKPSTHPSTEEYDQARGVAVNNSAVASAVSTEPHDVRAEWNLAYANHPITVVQSPHGSPPVIAEPSAATIFPNRGEAAMAANSATLYPPTNEFNVGPTRTASVYPRGPLSPTGYLGR